MAFTAPRIGIGQGHQCRDVVAPVPGHRGWSQSRRGHHAPVDDEHPVVRSGHIFLNDYRWASHARPPVRVDGVGR